MSMQSRLDEAVAILQALDLPRAQINERTALCLLALAHVAPDAEWREASAPLVGITPMMEFAHKFYGHAYAPNTRETFRRQSIHQFMQAGIAQKNPDALDRPVNSPNTVYQLTAEALDLVRSYGSANWAARLHEFLEEKTSLAERYAQERDMSLVPVSLPDGAEIQLSPGDHSELMKAIIEDFCPRFAPGGRVFYVGDTGTKQGFYDAEYASSIGIATDSHGKFPDVMVHQEDRNWLFLIESVTSHGPVDAKRHMELTDLFRGVTASLVFVSAFRQRAKMARFLGQIAWETEVWVEEAPSHLVHFNGDRFLGPY